MLLILYQTMNTTGTIFTLTTFGESHGDAVGGVVDGMPAGIEIDTVSYSRNSTDAARDKVP